MEPEAYQKKGGDEVLFQLTDRFPQQEMVDELGEIRTDLQLESC